MLRGYVTLSRKTLTKNHFCTNKCDEAAQIITWTSSTAETNQVTAVRCTVCVTAGFTLLLGCLSPLCSSHFIKPQANNWDEIFSGSGLIFFYIHIPFPFPNSGLIKPGPTGSKGPNYRGPPCRAIGLGLRHLWSSEGPRVLPALTPSLLQMGCSVLWTGKPALLGEWAGTSRGLGPSSCPQTSPGFRKCFLLAHVNAQQQMTLRNRKHEKSPRKWALEKDAFHLCAALPVSTVPGNITTLCTTHWV